MKLCRSYFGLKLCSFAGFIFTANAGAITPSKIERENARIEKESHALGALVLGHFEDQAAPAYLLESRLMADAKIKPKNLIGIADNVIYPEGEWPRAYENLRSDRVKLRISGNDVESKSDDEARKFKLALQDFMSTLPSKSLPDTMESLSCKTDLAKEAAHARDAYSLDIELDFDARFTRASLQSVPVELKYQYDSPDYSWAAKSKKSFGGSPLEWSSVKKPILSFEKMAAICAGLRKYGKEIEPGKYAVRAILPGKQLTYLKTEFKAEGVTGVKSAGWLGTQAHTHEGEQSVFSSFNIVPLN